MQKTEQPIRVLHVFGKLNRGGAESRVMDLYHHMDRSKVQFDFLVHYKAGNEEKRSGKSLEELRPPEDLDEEVRALGGRIYVLPPLHRNQSLGIPKSLPGIFRGTS